MIAILPQTMMGYDLCALSRVDGCGHQHHNELRLVLRELETPMFEVALYNGGINAPPDDSTNASFDVINYVILQTISHILPSIQFSDH